MKRVALVMTIVLPVALGACNGSTTAPPIIPLRLYVANSTSVGPAVHEVTWYSGSFSTSTVPGGAITLTGGSEPGVAIDPTNPAGAVYATDTASGGSVVAYPRPNPNGSAPLFTIASGINPGLLNFDVHGNLYFINFTNRTVNKVNNPVTSTSTPTVLITEGVTHVPQCATADAAGNLFVLEGGAGAHRVLEFAPPYTGAPVVTTSMMSMNTNGCALDPVTGQFFVVNNNGSVLGFNTPLTSGETPSVILNSSFNGTDGAAQLGIAFDPSGNLFIASVVFTASNATSSTISVYTGPTISSGQTAAFSFPNTSPTSPTTIVQCKQMAIGV